MNTQTELANFALMALGVGQIQSINDAGSSATLCANWIRHALRTTLAQGQYESTIKRSELVSVGSPSDGWTYRYTVPQGCLRVLAVLDDRYAADVGNQWETEAGYLQCDVAGAWLKFVAEPNDVSSLDNLVAEAVGYRLAMIIGPGLGMDQDNTALREVERRFITADGAARSVNRANRAPTVKARLWGKA